MFTPDGGGYRWVAALGTPWSWPMSERAVTIVNMTATQDEATPSEPRNVSVRISSAGAAWVDEVMARLETKQSVLLRAMFSVATHHPAEVVAKVAQLQSATSPADVPDDLGPTQ